METTRRSAAPAKGRAPPSSADEASDGSPWTRYAVIEELASGGMGVVYRVLDRVAGEERALKRVRPDTTSDPFFVQALEREYRVLATLDHPRIIRVFDCGVDDLGPYYTMEFLAGSDMRRASP
jgi:eukaryotic-like serine/threonine-protein kinase